MFCFSRHIFHWIKRSIYKACISLAQGRNNTSSVVFSMSFAISGDSPFLAHLSYLGEQHHHINWFTVVYCSTSLCADLAGQFPVFRNYFGKWQIFAEWDHIFGAAGLFILINNVNSCSNSFWQVDLEKIRNSVAIVVCWYRVQSAVPGQNKLFISHFWSTNPFKIFTKKNHQLLE